MVSITPRSRRAGQPRSFGAIRRSSSQASSSPWVSTTAWASTVSHRAPRAARKWSPGAPVVGVGEAPGGGFDADPAAPHRLVIGRRGGHPGFVVGGHHRAGRTGIRSGGRCSAACGERVPLGDPRGRLGGGEVVGRTPPWSPGQPRSGPLAIPGGSRLLQQVIDLRVLQPGADLTERPSVNRTAGPPAGCGGRLLQAVGGGGQPMHHDAETGIEDQEFGRPPVG